MPTTFLSREKGFTLLEVVFAVGILAIGIMGYTSLKISNKFSWVFAKNLSQAVLLTGANLEGLWMVGYHDVGWMSAGNHTGADKNDNNNTPTVKAGDFSANDVTWTVRERCPSELTKLVTYTTDWNVGGPKNVIITQVQVRP